MHNGKLPLQKEKINVMKKKRNHSLRPHFSPNYKMFCYQGWKIGDPFFSSNYKMFYYQGWKIGDLPTIFLLTIRCSAIKAEKQETCLSLFLLICLINLGMFLHLCTHDICCQVKPKLCRTKNLMRFTLALGLGWRRRVFSLARLKGRSIFGLCFLCLDCTILGFGGILGFWGRLDFLALAFILGHLIP